MTTTDQRSATEVLRLVSVGVQALDIDTELALIQFRKTAEFVLRHLFTLTYQSVPGRAGLDLLLQKLRERNALPLRVELNFRTLQSFGNAAAHGRSEEEPLTVQDIKPATAALFNVLEWFFDAILDNAAQYTHNLSSLTTIHGDADVAATAPSPVPDLWVEAPAVARPSNLDLSDRDPDGRPLGWFDGVGFVSRVSPCFQIQPSTTDGGPSAVCLSHPDPLPGEFGCMMQCSRGDQYAGQQLRLSARIGSEAVKDWAGLWLRIDGMNEPNLFFENMYGQAIRGDTTWHTYTHTVRLPPDTFWLNYGLVLEGAGSVTVEHFRLELRDEVGWRTL